MKNIKIIATAALMSIVVFTTHNVSGAEVRKISPEVLLDGYSNKVWSVSVVCAEIDDARFIERVGDSGKWCARDLPTTCSNKKVKVAKKVCGTHFERSVAKYRASQSDTSVEVRTEIAKVEPAKEPQDTAPSDLVADVDVELKTSAPEVKQPQVDSPETDTRIAMTKEMLEIEEEKIRLQKKKLELELMKLELEKQKQG